MEKTVLIVNYDLDLASRLVELIEKLGYKAYTVPFICGAGGALDYFEHHDKPDLLILDLALPKTKVDYDIANESLEKISNLVERKTAAIINDGFDRHADENYLVNLELLHNEVNSRIDPIAGFILLKGLQSKGDVFDNLSILFLTTEIDANIRQYLQQNKLPEDYPVITMPVRVDVIQKAIEGAFLQ